ncbi:MAG: uroporphyrinogen decarboxylase [Parachlamydiaceae bacterium]
MATNFVKENLLLDALHCRNNGRVPVWFMRQAGRYMPEYRALRAKHSFLEMCHTPELIVEVTQQPLRAFGMDAAILFSDILVIPEALGVGLHFDDGAGPIIDRPLSTLQDVVALPPIDMREALNYVTEGIRLLSPTLDVPLIGFCGAPFTVASYMIEGKTSRDLRKTKQWMLRDPESFHLLLERLFEDSITYLEMQIDAGVDAIQIFDSWAGFLGHSQFKEFSLAYLDKMVKRLKPKVPVILFCRGASVFAPDIVHANPSAISVDWNGNLAAIRKSVPTSIALQGNLDPDILYASHSTIKREALALLNSMRGDPGYIFNLGHGITPGVPVDAVKVLVDCVQGFA